MSKYTTEVRYICEERAGLTESVGYNDVATVIAKSRAKIFSFPYPIFDENYRSVLETKILKHYYTREIGFETFGLWQLKLDMRMNEIMPYYNQLYESELIKFNPLYDTDLTKDHKKTNTGEDTKRRNTDETINRDIHTEFETDQHTEGESWEYYSDTPQGTVGNLDNLQYLTNATKRTVDEDVHTEGTTDTDDDTVRHETVNQVDNFDHLEDYLEHLVGKSPGKSYAKMIQEYRDIFLNIDMMIIDELKDLFMYLW